MSEHKRDGSLESVSTLNGPVEKNQPATIRNANEPVRYALNLSKSRSAVLNPSVQQASFSPMPAFPILS